jgi:predicted YcjX-like family ATPase|tara:strand:- start:530 stop:811 length:282 start_codon:yes stop_codon:yes gene_type:complete
LGVSEDAQALLDGQHTMNFMTEEYKEDERRRKQSGIERKARRAVSGANLTKAQKLEHDRHERMKEIVKRNKEDGKVLAGGKKRNVFGLATCKN